MASISDDETKNNTEELGSQEEIHDKIKLKDAVTSEIKSLGKAQEVLKEEAKQVSHNDLLKRISDSIDNRGSEPWAVRNKCPTLVHIGEDKDKLFPVCSLFTENPADVPQERLASSADAISNRQEDRASQNTMLHKDNAIIKQRSLAMHRQQGEERYREDVATTQDRRRRNQGILEKLIRTIFTIRHAIICGNTSLCYEDEGQKKRSTIRKFGNFAVKIITRKSAKRCYGDERREWHRLGGKRNASKYINVMLLCFEVRDTMYFVSELGHCDLYEYVKQQKFTTTQTAFELTLQAASALQWLHNQGCIHRDIKLENYLLFPRNTLKLIDFEFTIYCGLKGNAINPQRVGTKRYLAPELIKQYKSPFLKEYKFTPACDAYAFGKSFQMIHFIITPDYQKLFLEKYYHATT